MQTFRGFSFFLTYLPLHFFIGFVFPALPSPQECLLLFFFKISFSFPWCSYTFPPLSPSFPASFPASFPLFGGVDCRRIVAPILYFHFNKVTKSIANINSKREQIKIDRKGGKTGLNLIRWKKGKEQNLPLSLYFFIFPFLSKERWKGKKKECQFRNFHPLFSEIRIFSCDVTGKQKERKKSSFQEKWQDQVRINQFQCQQCDV